MISTRHVLSQGPMLRSLGRTAVLALAQRLRSRGTTPHTPGAWIEAELEPPPPALVHDFVRAMGGDPDELHGRLPPHLFPQWGLALAARALEGVPYPMLRVMNAGCELRLNAPLPAGERLHVRARLESIDETDTRAMLSTRIITGTRSAPDALDATLHAFVPLARRSGTKKDAALVATDAREIERVALGVQAGLDFAKLTGDFNPIHWVAAYARMAGFRGSILHGFGTFAHAVQAVSEREFGGDTYALRTIQARFTKPLVLPAQVGVFVGGANNQQIFVGEAAGAEAYLVGSFEIAQPA